jgi:hypothetical protein
MDYLSGLRRKTHVVLIDHEGGKLGEVNFKRSFERERGGKRGIGRHCARVLSWGAAQTAWLADLGIVDPSRIVTTGSPRLDPYMVPAVTNGRRHLGVTLRGDVVTGRPYKLMENLFRRLSVESLGGLSVGYPTWAQQEDRLWHVFASTRYMFKIAQEVSRRTQAPIVMRPGPWERHGMYAFLPKRIPTITIAPDQSQPAYVRNAFAVVDESTSLSLEAYVAGTPTITTQALIPRLEEHTGGDGRSAAAPTIARRTIFPRSCRRSSAGSIAMCRGPPAFRRPCCTRAPCGDPTTSSSAAITTSRRCTPTPTRSRRPSRRCCV